MACCRAGRASRRRSATARAGDWPAWRVGTAVSRRCTKYSAAVHGSDASTQRADAARAAKSHVGRRGVARIEVGTQRIARGDPVAEPFGRVNSARNAPEPRRRRHRLRDSARPQRRRRRGIAAVRAIARRRAGQCFLKVERARRSTQPIVRAFPPRRIPRPISQLRAISGMRWPFRSACPAHRCWCALQQRDGDPPDVRSSSAVSAQLTVRRRAFATA